jgi:hypothetical protein
MQSERNKDRKEGKKAKKRHAVCWTAPASLNEEIEFLSALEGRGVVVTTAEGWKFPLSKCPVVRYKTFQCMYLISTGSTQQWVIILRRVLQRTYSVCNCILWRN